MAQLRVARRPLQKQNKHLCNYCPDRAIRSRHHFYLDYAWTTYECKRCNQLDVSTEEGLCVRCGLPGERFCSVCQMEVSHISPYIKDTIELAGNFADMFNSTIAKGPRGPNKRKEPQVDQATWMER